MHSTVRSGLHATVRSTIVYTCDGSDVFKHGSSTITLICENTGNWTMLLGAVNNLQYSNLYADNWQYLRDGCIGKWCFKANSL